MSSCLSTKQRILLNTIFVNTVFIITKLSSISNFFIIFLPNSSALLKSLLSGRPFAIGIYSVENECSPINEPTATTLNSESLAME